MDGYTILAETYRRVGHEKEARVFDLLASCDKEDLGIMFSSGAFNDVIAAYNFYAERTGVPLYHALLHRHIDDIMRFYREQKGV